MESFKPIFVESDRKSYSDYAIGQIVSKLVETIRRQYTKRINKFWIIATTNCDNKKRVHIIKGPK